MFSLEVCATTELYRVACFICMFSIQRDMLVHLSAGRFNQALTYHRKETCRDDGKNSCKSQLCSSPFIQCAWCSSPFTQCAWCSSPFTQCAWCSSPFTQCDGAAAPSHSAHGAAAPSRSVRGVAAPSHSVHGVADPSHSVHGAAAPSHSVIVQQPLHTVCVV